MTKEHSQLTRTSPEAILEDVRDFARRAGVIPSLTFVPLVSLCTSKDLVLRAYNRAGLSPEDAAALKVRNAESRIRAYSVRRGRLEQWIRVGPSHLLRPGGEPLSPAAADTLLTQQATNSVRWNAMMTHQAARFRCPGNHGEQLLFDLHVQAQTILRSLHAPHLSLDDVDYDFDRVSRSARRADVADEAVEVLADVAQSIKIKQMLVRLLAETHGNAPELASLQLNQTRLRDPTVLAHLDHRCQQLHNALAAEVTDAGAALDSAITPLEPYTIVPSPTLDL